MDINIFNKDAEEFLKQLPDNSIDMSIQSPPYDHLRKYQGAGDDWNFDKFKAIADQLYRVMKEGSVTVWVVGDATVNGGRTLTCFRQALYFQEIGFLIHDDMIWQKPTSARPQSRNSKRYSNIYEHFFILVKGKKIRQDITLICDKPNKYAGLGSWGHISDRKSGDDDLINLNKKIRNIPEFSLRNNIWVCNMANVDGDKEFKHPAAFSIPLVKDNILSWSVEGDLVLDCFMGSATTAIACMDTKRRFVGCELIDKYYDEMAKPRIMKHMTNEYTLYENTLENLKHE